MPPRPGPTLGPQAGASHPAACPRGSRFCFSRDSYQRPRRHKHLNRGPIPRAKAAHPKPDVAFSCLETPVLTSPSCPRALPPWPLKHLLFMIRTCGSSSCFKPSRCPQAGPLLSLSPLAEKLGVSSFFRTRAGGKATVLLSASRPRFWTGRGERKVRPNWVAQLPGCLQKRGLQPPGPSQAARGQDKSSEARPPPGTPPETAFHSTLGGWGVGSALSGLHTQPRPLHRHLPAGDQRGFPSSREPRGAASTRGTLGPLPPVARTTCPRHTQGPGEGGVQGALAPPRTASPWI